MKAIFTILLLFSFPVFAQSETEAGASCVGKECLSLAGVSSEEVTNLCLKSLPEHCQSANLPLLRKKYNICLGDGGYFPVFSETLSCLHGGFEGLLIEPLKIIKGTWDLVFDKETRDEALEALSFLSEEVSGEEGNKTLKDILFSPMVEAGDKFVQCLNYKGRFEYICRRGFQLAAGFYALNKVQKIRQAGKAVKEKRQAYISTLSDKDKRLQQKELDDLLSSDKMGSVKIEKLTPYQISRLPQDGLQKIDFSDLKNETADYLTRHQLNSIPVKFYKNKKANDLSYNLERLKDDKFRYFMDKGIINDLNESAIAQNLHRMPSHRIRELDNLPKIHPLSVVKAREKGGWMSNDYIAGIHSNFDISWEQAKAFRKNGAIGVIKRDSAIDRRDMNVENFLKMEASAYLRDKHNVTKKSTKNYLNSLIQAKKTERGNIATQKGFSANEAAATEKLNFINRQIDLLRKIRDK